MTYNKVNGVHTANNYDLCTTVARGDRIWRHFYDQTGRPQMQMEVRPQQNVYQLEMI